MDFARQLADLRRAKHTELSTNGFDYNTPGIKGGIGGPMSSGPSASPKSWLWSRPTMSQDCESSNNIIILGTYHPLVCPNARYCPLPVQQWYHQHLVSAPSTVLLVGTLPYFVGQFVDDTSLHRKGTSLLGVCRRHSVRCVVGWASTSLKLLVVTCQSGLTLAFAVSNQTLQLVTWP